MPYLLEKIVEKIVIMPQVVEVLKYVHEIVEEETLGVAVGADISISEVRYKELYAQLRIHFETVLAELRKLKVNTPGLKIQIEIIETFLAELDKLIQFPRFYQVEKEKIVEKEVNRPVLVPTETSQSILKETSYAVLIDQLITELKRITRDNPQVHLQLDEEINLMFFSDFDNKADSRLLNKDLNTQLRSYKESQRSKLFSLGKTWTQDHELILNTILEERFTMANVIKKANLEIEKSKSIADSRLEAYRALRQNYALSQTKLENLEREIGVLSKNFEGNSSISGELRTIFSGLQEVRNVLTVDPRTLQTEEYVQVLGDIHGQGDGFVRLQSAFRALERENQLLKERYVKWQKEIPNAQLISDKERIIENLSRQLSSLTTELSTAKSQPHTSVNVSGNTQEYEIKIRTLNSRIQELESQLRTQRVDYEGQLRQKNNFIRELEERLQSNKIDDSRATGIQSSGIERMTESQRSNSSASGSQVASSYTTGQSNVSSNISQTGGMKSYGGYGTSGTQPTTYAAGNTTGTTQNVTSSSYRTSTYGSGLSGSGLSGSGVGISGSLSGSGVGQSGTSATYGATTTSNYTSGTTGATYGQGSTSYGTSSGVRYSTSTSGAGTGATGATGVTGASTTQGSGYTPYTSYYNRGKQ